MRKLAVSSIVLALLLVRSGLLIDAVAAAERDRPIRIGALTASWGPTPHIVGLRDGLVALGYREDEDFVIGVRFTQGDAAALPVAARELIQYGVDLIFATSTLSAKAAQQATQQIPIVFNSGADPVQQGLVQSFARPGGNITGVFSQYTNLSPKRLELFREIIPALKRVVFLYSAGDPIAEVEVRGYRDAARQLGVVLVEQPVRTEAEVQAVLAQIRKDEVDGLLMTSSLSLNIPGFTLEAASQRAIPAMVSTPFFVEQGALAGYGTGAYQRGRQIALLVDKLLKGANPAELPVEVYSKIELVINLKTARKLGLTIPPEVLFRADRLIR